MYVPEVIRELDKGVNDRYLSGDPMLLVMEDQSPDFVITSRNGSELDIAHYVFAQKFRGDYPIRNVVALGVFGNDKVYASLLFDGIGQREGQIYGIGAGPVALFGIANALDLPDESYTGFESLE